ncbi:MAG: hypothetical protein MJ173_04325 [Clostridia bacterium]|nr:hypothetical protein [Clostridia bacterium]
MKKKAAKFASVILALSIVFSSTTIISASAGTSPIARVGISALGGIIRGVIGGINAIIPDNKNFGKVSEHSTENFYSGTETFKDSADAGAKWKLGYCKNSLIPDDIFEGEYYLGGFMSMQNGMKNKVEEVVGGMDVRAIALDDSSGRGITVFANIDCIGFSNGDIKAIRELVAKKLPDVKFTSINISSTHCHSCIDTQGLWTNLFPKLLKNLVKSYFRLDMERGVNTEYMEGFLYEAVADAIVSAATDMNEGTLKVAKKNINKDYFNNKNRKSASALITEMTRLTFIPDDQEIRPTMLVNVAGHPDVTGLAVDKEDNGRQLSGDYVTYMQDTVEAGGYNFMFIQGPIAGIYMGRGLTNDDVDTNPDRRYMQSVRYGIELGKIALYLTNTVEEIEADYQQNHSEDWAALQADIRNHNEKVAAGTSTEERYTLWYKDWTPTTETEVSPLLNIKLAEVKVEVTNPLIILVGKLNLANYAVCKQGLKYYIFVEIGYCEIGELKFVMMPGEICQDLVAGGTSLTAEGSFSGKEFGLPCIYEIFGEDTVCFGLMNDAVGYVVPDNDYTAGIVDEHYHELLSLGKTEASSIMEGFVKLHESLN